MEYSDGIIQDDLGTICAQDVDWGRLRGATVLITGATGMLATYMGYTVHYLNETAHLGVHAILTYRNREKLERKFTGLLDCDDLTFVAQDVVKPMSVEGPVDWIIHAAGNASPHYIHEDPVGIIDANVRGTRELLNLAREKSVKGFHFLSTREVYGQAPLGIASVSEDDFGVLPILEARSCYPESKRLAETLIRSYSDQYGVPFTVSRIAHSYGPGMSIAQDGRIMSDLISNVVNDQDITLKSTGDATRAFCYIADSVAAVFMIMLNGRNGQAYNIANEDEPISIASLANRLVALFPEKSLKVIFEIPNIPDAGYAKFKRVPLSTEKLQELGWKKKINLDEGILKTVSSFA